MNYLSELEFLQNYFKKCRINTKIIELSDTIDSSIDNGLRLLINLKDEYNKTFRELFGEIKENTIYTNTDRFYSSYIFFYLPETNKKLLLIGPFLKNAITRDDILFLSQQLKLDFEQVKSVENYFGSIPYVSDKNFFYNLIDAFCERIWQNQKVNHYVDIKGNKTDSQPILQKDDNNSYNDEEKNLINMKMMENRYAFENELIRAVSNGQTHLLENLMSNFTDISFEERLTDKLRNYKNYCIIMNTLLRKAAENGGVHPLYIDRVSSNFAKEIEEITAFSAVPNLMSKIIQKYGELVKENSIKNYSSPVQKAIISIDSDLTADLSLNHLSSIQNISPAYLSNIFHKETGDTLTDFVNKKRISYAKRLLDTTNMQIQAVAQRCGIVDIHYFSRIFKKQVGCTPKEYREKSIKN